MDLAQRKTLFGWGTVLTLVPIFVWIVLPGAVFSKLAAFFRMDDRLIEAYCFMSGAILELVALYFFERARRRPWDWLSVSAVTGGTISVIATIVFWGAAAAVVMQGW